MTDEKEMRQVLANTLAEIANTDKRIVVLEADLMGCHATKAFKEAHPDRFVNVGIAEANMIGIAAGMSAMGKIPFAYSFAPFATRRCYDTIFISVAYAKQHVKIVGSDPGIMAEANGGTHMPFEDMAIMRAIPNMVCFEPTDGAMLARAIPQIIDYPGAVYIRLFRKKPEHIFDDVPDFKLGKAITVKAGKDVTLVASGIMVEKALKAAEILKEEGIDAGVFEYPHLETHRRRSNRQRGQDNRRARHVRKPHLAGRSRQRGVRSRRVQVPGTRRHDRRQQHLWRSR